MLQSQALVSFAIAPYVQQFCKSMPIGVRTVQRKGLILARPDQDTLDVEPIAQDEASTHHATLSEVIAASACEPHH